MPPRRYELTWDDVQTVAAKIEEVAPPITREKIANAFGVASSTVTKIANRDGWADELNRITSKQLRSVDEALKAVASLVA